MMLIKRILQLFYTKLAVDNSVDNVDMCVKRGFKRLDKRRLRQLLTINESE